MRAAFQCSHSPRTFWLAVSTLALTLVQAGCASEAAGDGETADDLTSAAASHANLVRKCDAEERAAIVDTDITAAIRTKAQTCIANANDTTAKKLDARLASPPESGSAVWNFRLFRRYIQSACSAYVAVRVDRGEPNLDVPYLKATCARDAEYAMAQMLQTYGNLGGKPAKDIWPVSQGTQGGCFVRFRNNSSELRECVEVGVIESIRGFATDALEETVQVLKFGNDDLCQTIALRSGGVTDAPSLNACGTQTAILLEFLQKGRGRDSR